MVEDVPYYSSSKRNAQEWDWTKPNALKWCGVSLSEVIATGKRLEASVFDPDGKRARKLIETGQFPFQHITGDDGLASAYRIGQFKRILVPKSDYPFYQPSTILDIMPKPDGYLSIKTDVDIESLRCQEGQVLLTRSGTIGNVAFVSKTLDKKVFSDDLIRINCKNKNDSAFLYAYLKSKLGRKIVLTNNYGSVISHIEPEHLDTIPIPIPTEELKDNIANLILSSFKLRDESNELWKKATELLYHELHLVDFHDFITDSKNIQNTFSVKYSALDKRFDGSYHIPLVKSIISIFEKYADEVTTIGDPRISSAVILPGRFKRSYVTEGYGRVFIGGKQISELDPSNKKYLSNKQHNARIIKELELKENMVLITCSGTIGKVVLVPKHWDKWSASQHIIRVIPASKNIAGYLAVYLTSAYGNELVKRFTYGAVVDEVDDKQISKVEVPLLKDKSVQKKINDLILSANDKRYEAYLLEQQALKMMNEDVLGV